ncbi:hypothetical protein B0H14DRAFT_2591960 [Mycena olivaceomarginata]|nr:hypothetical protein B0H14DRAFT_2591960 [Mycena olivaceomarginata]
MHGGLAWDYIAAMGRRGVAAPARAGVGRPRGLGRLSLSDSPGLYGDVGADEYSNWQLGILAAHRDFETRDIQTPLRLRCTCDESVFFPPTTIVTHCRALVKNQAQDTRRKNTNSVASYDVFSGIWGSLGFCNSVYLAMAIWFSSLECRLRVCAHGYTQGLVFFVVQISRSGTILYPIIYNKYL